MQDLEQLNFTIVRLCRLNDIGITIARWRFFFLFQDGRYLLHNDRSCHSRAKNKISKIL